MTQLHETAYPRLKAEPTAQDLEEVYTLTPEEVESLGALLAPSKVAASSATTVRGIGLGVRMSMDTILSRGAPSLVLT